MNKAATRVYDAGIGISLLVAIPVIIAWLLESRLRLPWPYAVAFAMSVSSASLILVALTLSWAGDQDFGLGKKWNTDPFPHLLRHSDRHMNSMTKNRMHHRLSILFSDGSKPSLEWESCNAVSADALYSGWAKRLFYAVRDEQRFPDLFLQRARYKRLLRLRCAAPIGIIFSVLSGLVGLASLLVLRETRSFNGISTCLIILCSILSTGFWVHYKSRSFVYRAAVQYVDEVVLAVDRLFHDHWKQRDK